MKLIKLNKVVIFVSWLLLAFHAFGGIVLISNKGYEWGIQFFFMSLVLLVLILLLESVNVILKKYED